MHPTEPTGSTLDRDVNEASQPQIGDITARWWAGITSRLALLLELVSTEATLAVRSLALVLFASVLAAMLLLVSWCAIVGTLAFIIIERGAHWAVVFSTLGVLHAAGAVTLFLAAQRLLTTIGFHYSRAAIKGHDPESAENDS